MHVMETGRQWLLAMRVVETGLCGRRRQGCACGDKAPVPGCACGGEVPAHRCCELCGGDCAPALETEGWRLVHAVETGRWRLCAGAPVHVLE